MVTTEVKTSVEVVQTFFRPPRVSPVWHFSNFHVHLYLMFGLIKHSVKVVVKHCQFVVEALAPYCTVFQLLFVLFFRRHLKHVHKLDLIEHEKDVVASPQPMTKEVFVD